VSASTIALPVFSTAFPEMTVVGAACAALLVDAYAGRRGAMLAWVIALAGLAVAAWFTLDGMGGAPVLTFSGMFVRDSLGDTLKLALYAVTGIALLYSRTYLHDRGIFRAEYVVLVLFAATGIMVMASAANFLSLYLGLELLALSQYALVGFRRDWVSGAEAAMKYFVLGALASGMLLYGLSMIYGVTGALDIGAVRAAVASAGTNNLILVFGLIFVVVGIGFKLGAVPFHMWIPDVYQGAPTSVTLFVGSAPKLAGFAIVIRLLVGGLEGLAGAWQDMLVILAVLSIGIGNVVAIAQGNLKRMLAYSTIAHMGYFLLGIISGTPAGYSASLFYVIVYAFTSLAAFGLLVLMSHQGFECERLDDLKGLNRRSRWYAFLVLLVMFSLAGVPPTVGFFAKFVVIKSLVEVGMVWLAVVAVLFAVIGAFYYLRAVRLVYFEEPEDSSPVRVGADVAWLIGANCLALVLVLPWVGWLLEACASALRTAAL